MKSIVPNELQSYYDDWKMSPGLLSNGHIFFTGFTGDPAWTAIEVVGFVRPGAIVEIRVVAKAPD